MIRKYQKLNSWLRGKKKAKTGLLPLQGTESTKFMKGQ